MTTVQFRFGDAKQHLCKVILGIAGHETYLVNDVVMLKNFSWRFGGVARFTAHGHAVEVHVRVGLPPQGKAIVDGVLINDDLFGFKRLKKRERRLSRIGQLKSGSGSLVSKILVWAVVVALLVLLFKQFDKNDDAAKSDFIATSPASLITGPGRG